MALCKSLKIDAKRTKTTFIMDEFCNSTQRLKTHMNRSRRNVSKKILAAELNDYYTEIFDNNNTD